MADITNLRSPAEAGLSKLFEAARQSFASEAAIAREEAFRFFEATGLPSRRVEAFKYTDLRAAITDAAPPAEAPVSTPPRPPRRGEGLRRDRGRAPDLRQRPSRPRAVRSRLRSRRA